MGTFALTVFALAIAILALLDIRWSLRRTRETETRAKNAACVTDLAAAELLQLLASRRAAGSLGGTRNARSWSRVVLLPFLGIMLFWEAPEERWVRFQLADLRATAAEVRRYLQS